MSITLETLLVEFQADFSKLDQAMERAVTKSKNKAQTIENLTIKPNVDLDPLHDLNKLLDVKQQHLKETIDYFKNNPIVTYTEESKTGGKGATSRASTKEDIDAQFKESFKKSSDVVHNIFRSAIRAGLQPLASIIDGVFHGVGSRLSRELSNALADSLSAELYNATGKTTKQWSQDLANALGDAIRNARNNASEQQPKGITQQPPKAIAPHVDQRTHIQDPRNYKTTQIDRGEVSRNTHIQDPRNYKTTLVDRGEVSRDTRIQRDVNAARLVTIANQPIKVEVVNLGAINSTKGKSTLPVNGGKSTLPSNSGSDTQSPLLPHHQYLALNKNKATPFSTKIQDTSLAISPKSGALEEYYRKVDAEIVKESLATKAVNIARAKAAQALSIFAKGTYEAVVNIGAFSVGAAKVVYDLVPLDNAVKQATLAAVSVAGVAMLPGGAGLIGGGANLLLEAGGAIGGAAGGAAGASVSSGITGITSAVVESLLNSGLFGSGMAAQLTEAIGSTLASTMGASAEVITAQLATVIADLALAGGALSLGSKALAGSATALLTSANASASLEAGKNVGKMLAPAKEVNAELVLAGYEESPLKALGAASESIKETTTNLLPFNKEVKLLGASAKESSQSVSLVAKAKTTSKPTVTSNAQPTSDVDLSTVEDAKRRIALYKESHKALNKTGDSMKELAKIVKKGEKSPLSEQDIDVARRIIQKNTYLANSIVGVYDAVRSDLKGLMAVYPESKKELESYVASLGATRKKAMDFLNYASGFKSSSNSVGKQQVADGFSGEFKNIGRDIDLGIKVGAHPEKFKQLGREQALALHKAFKAALEIRSPSRKYMESGDDVYKGTEIGGAPNKFKELGKKQANALHGGFVENSKANTTRLEKDEQARQIAMFRAQSFVRQNIDRTNRQALIDSTKDTVVNVGIANSEIARRNQNAAIRKEQRANRQQQVNIPLVAPTSPYDRVALSPAEIAGVKNLQSNPQSARTFLKDLRANLDYAKRIISKDAEELHNSSKDTLIGISATRAILANAEQSEALRKNQRANSIKQSPKPTVINESPYDRSALSTAEITGVKNLQSNPQSARTFLKDLRAKLDYAKKLINAEAEELQDSSKDTLIGISASNAIDAKLRQEAALWKENRELLAYSKIRRKRLLAAMRGDDVSTPNSMPEGNPFAVQLYNQATNVTKRAAQRQGVIPYNNVETRVAIRPPQITTAPTPYIKENRSVLDPNAKFERRAFFGSYEDLLGVSNIKNLSKEHVDELKRQQEAYRKTIAEARAYSAAIRAAAADSFARRKIADTAEARHQARKVNGMMSDDAIDSFVKQQIRTFRKAVGNAAGFKGEGAVSKSSDLMNNMAGVGFSAAMMMSPKVGLGLLVSPLLLPMSNLIITMAGVANMLKPFVGFTMNAIKATESTTGKFNSLTEVRGGNSDSEYAFATGLANKYKQDVKTVLQGYTDMSAAAYKTTLQGKSLEVLFEGVLASARVARLTTDETQGIVKAYTQMIGKNAIQMEELRGQLGDRFAPAMQDFATALGVGVDQLVAMSRQGKLTASDLAVVGEFMKNKYAESAMGAANTFTAASAVLGNAWFNLQAEVSDSMSGMFAGVTDLITKIVNALPSMIGTLKLLGTSLVIGIAAVFAVGTQAILGVPKVANIMRVVQGTFMAGWGAAMRGLTPFFLASFIDLFDKVLGTDNTTVDNVSLGLKNLFIGAFAGVNEAIQGVIGIDFLNNNLFEKGLLPDLKKEKGEKGFLDKFNIPSGLVELPALMLMMQQTAVLAGMFIMPKLKDIGGGFRQVGNAMKEAFSTSGIRNIRSALLPLNAEVASLAKTFTSLGIQAAIAFGLMALARSKFTTDLEMSMSKELKNLANGFKDLQNLAAENQPTNTGAADKPQTRGLQSLGLELKIGKVLGFTDKSFRSDDLIKLVDSFKNREVSESRQKLIDTPVSEMGAFQKRRVRYEVGTNTATLGYLQANKDLSEAILFGEHRMTIAQTRAVGTMQELQNLTKATPTILKQLGLTAGKGSLLAPNTGFGEALADAKGYAAELAKLNQQKLQLLTTGSSPDSPEVMAISSKTRDLLDIRAKTLKPLFELRDGVKAQEAQLLKSRDLILKSFEEGEINVPTRDLFLAEIDKPLGAVKKALDFMKGEGVDAVLDPIADDWARIVGELKKADYVTSRLQAKAKLGTTKQLQSLYSSNVDNLTLADTERKINVSGMESQISVLERHLNERQALLAEMMAVPLIETDDAKRKEMEALQKEVTSATQELADSKLNLAKARREIALIQETRRVRNTFAIGQNTVDGISNRAALATFNNNINELNTKLRTDMNASTSAIFESNNKLKEANLNLSSNVEQVNSSLSFLGKNLKQDTKDWLTKSSGLSGDFNTQVRNIATKDVSRISAAKSEEIEATPERKQLISELGEIAQLNDVIRQNKVSQLQAQVDIKNLLKQQKDAYESFVDGLNTEVDNARNAVKELKLKNVFTEFSLKVREGLLAGTTSIVKTLTDVIMSSFDNLPGVLGTMNAAESDAKSNSKQIKSLEKQLQENTVDLRFVPSSMVGDIASNQPKSVVPTAPTIMDSVSTTSPNTVPVIRSIKDWHASLNAAKVSTDAVTTEVTRSIETKQDELAVTTNANQALADLVAVRKEEQVLAKASSTIEFKKWLLDFNDTMTRTLRDVQDATKEASKSVAGFTTKLSDLNAQFINPLSPLESALKTVRDAFKSFTEELDVFTTKTKRDLGITDETDITGKSSKEIVNMIGDNVDVSSVFNAINKDLPAGLNPALSDIQAKYNKGLITNKEALADLLSQVDVLKGDAGKKQSEAELREAAKIERQTRSKQADYEFGQKNNVLENNDYGFKSETQKDSIAKYKDILKYKNEYRKAIESITELEASNEITVDEANKRREEAQGNLNDLLEMSYKKYNVLNQQFEKFKESASQAIADSTINLGKALFNGGDKEKALAEQRLDYADKLNEIAKEYGDSPEKFKELKDQLDVINNSKLDGLKSQFSVLGSVLGTLKSALGDFALQLAKTLAMRAASKAITGIFGFSGGTENYSSGVENYSSGVENYSSGTPNYANGVTFSDVFGAMKAKDYAGLARLKAQAFRKDGGGNVMSSAVDATPDQLGLSVRQAMIREGTGATPAVLHKGEAVLSTRNKDAQLYRALLKSGAWSQLKTTTKINNYANGTDINNPSASNNNWGQSVRNTSVTTNINVITKDYQGFNRSSEQLRNAQSMRDNLTANRYA